MAKRPITVKQLKEYGFRVSTEMEEVLGKLGWCEILRRDRIRGKLVAKIFVDNDTDIVIEQNEQRTGD